MKKIIIIFIIIISFGIIYYYYYMPKKQTEKSIQAKDTSIVEDHKDEEIICKINSKQNLNLIEEKYKGYNVSAKLVIPKIDLEAYVLEDYNIEALKVSVTKFWGNNPNDIGNFCIAGHNYKEFKNITKLNIGDIFTLTDNYNGIIQYEIYDIYKVLPKQTECLSQNTNGRKEVTLITCTTNSKKRVIVKAKEIV